MRPAPALLTALLLCLFAAPLQAADRLPVVASFSLLGDMAAQIGGDDIGVSTLVGPDQDAHAFSPSPEDAKKIAGAKLVILNGLGFEGWMTRLIEASGFKGPVVIASTGIQPRTFEDGETDPHAWQDLRNGKIYAHNIGEALATALPAKASAIRARAQAYADQIEKMDQEVRAALASVPSPQRKIITSHDAFGYFGAAYGLTFLAPQGLNTESEASAKDVSSLIRQIKQEKVRQVFIENMTNPKLIRQIARESGARLGGELYSDALSAPKGEAPTYLQMFRSNVAKIKAAMLENGR